jgi:hypothetical protein
MWKGVYGEYKEAYSDLVFQKDALKDCFQNVLKEFKTNRKMKRGLKK